MPKISHKQEKGETPIKMLDDSDRKLESIKKFGRITVQTLIKIAPDLIGSFVPGGMILAKGLETIIEKSDIDKILTGLSPKVK